VGPLSYSALRGLGHRWRDASATVATTSLETLPGGARPLGARVRTDLLVACSSADDPRQSSGAEPTVDSASERPARRIVHGCHRGVLYQGRITGGFSEPAFLPPMAALPLSAGHAANRPPRPSELSIPIHSRWCRFIRYRYPTTSTRCRATRRWLDLTSCTPETTAASSPSWPTAPPS